MDGAHSDTHSDSDSGESWTLLEAGPSVAATPSPRASPAFPTAAAGDGLDGTDKDEDTDGISIISDSESESIAACEQAGRDGTHSEEPLQHQRRPTDVTVPTFQVIPQATDIHNISNESTGCDDFLGDSTGKLKTYVHRRNKKVSSVLNVILLGSVITAAGVALGHMWGAREDCSLQTAPSVNKILSNLYKLQEENAFLRSKLKELTATGNFQLHKKNHADKLSINKQNKCKRVFEEPLQHTNVVKTTKCMDLEVDIAKENVEFRKTKLTLPVESTDESTSESGVNEVDFTNDIRKLKRIYRDNKHWLDAEVAQRLKGESMLKKVQAFKKLKTLSKEKPKERHEPKIDGVTIQLQTSEEDGSSEKTDEIIIGPMPLTTKQKEPSLQKIVSYADSVKSAPKNKNSLEDEESIKKKEDIEITTNRPEKKKYKRKLEKMENELTDDDYDWGYDFSKDKRYSASKQKSEKIKHDRQKPYKKQKRDNKYEQWQMKGGYMKDFDSISSMASEENFDPLKNYDMNHFSREWERVNYMDQFSDIESIAGNKEKSSKGEVRSEALGNHMKQSNKIKDTSCGTDWFEKRSALRKQARERLEADLLKGNKTKSARWYFRRMSDREQCRVRTDNADVSKRKPSKRQFNYKNRR